MNRPASDPASRRRIRVLTVLVLSLFAVAALRAAYLQLLAAPGLRARGADQRMRRLKLLPARGTIYDRHLRELAVSVPGASIFVDPSVLLGDPAAVRTVAAALGMDAKETERALSHGGSRFAWLKRRISPAEEDAVRALRQRVPGVGIAREAHRFYPKKTLAGQALGFVGIEEEGLGGLESKYERVLKGRDVWVSAERDARGGLLLADAPEPTEGRGKNLVLTLDEAIQHIVEEELAAAVEKSAAKGGWAVAMEPATGEILALAQVPFFNPNRVSASPGPVRKIRAVSDVYEPGSTFKSLFLGVLLDRGFAKATDMVFCENGAWTVGRHTIHDHSPHGWLSVAEVLKVSSNIGVAKLSDRLTPQDFYDGLARFGVGAPTGVDLPGESRGILPPPDTWWKSTAKTIAFGQGVSATALQVTSALCAIANGGTRVRPHLVRAVLDETGREVERVPTQTVGTALSSQAASELGRMMEEVVQGVGGTAPQAQVQGYTVAGKTGTAWKPDPTGRGYLRGALVVSFMGYVPSRSPRLALLVAVDEPSEGSLYGGTIAGPAFREMAGRILAYLQVPPDRPEAVAAKPEPAPATSELPEAPAETVETGLGAMPDVRGMTMRDALRRVEAAGVGVRLSLVGSGVAAQQEPPPGMPLAQGAACRITFEPLL